jgi:putative tricarboxylic transport membrane protein
MFPLVIGCCLALGGGTLALDGWQRRLSEPLIALADWGRSPRHLINLALTVGCLLAFAFFVRQIGFAVLTFFTVAILLWRFGQPAWRAALIALVAAAGLQILFVSLMRVPLPPGILLGLVY